MTDLNDWKAQVEGQEYAKALADGRVLRWHPISNAPNDRVIIMGALFQGDDWYMRRAMPGTGNLVTIDDNGEPVYATHWCEDILGTPYFVVRTPACVPGVWRA